MLESIIPYKSTINCGGKLLDLKTPKVMGILNLTPDSFYDGGKYLSKKAIYEQVHKMVKEGVDIIDVGGFSSRPSATMIPAKEEIQRIKMGLEIIRSIYPDICLSIDTYRSEVAEIAVNDFDVQIINDISAGELDVKMFKTVAKLKVPYIMMHMRGNPENMQNKTKYNDLINDIFKYFADKISRLKSIGVADIILDPGFGFSKNLDQNFELLQRLNEFSIAALPLLVGFSRKSMIYKLLDITPDESLNGTTVLNVLALTNGANILRVHDVKPAKQAVSLYLKMNKN